jgi:hypothetical protein
MGGHENTGLADLMPSRSSHKEEDLGSLLACAVESLVGSNGWRQRYSPARADEISEHRREK